MFGFPKQDFLSTLLSKVGYFRAHNKLQWNHSRGFTVLTYHRICEQVPSFSYPFDPELLSATTAEFDWQMHYISQHFKAAKLIDLLRASRDGNPIPPRSIAVTFDDGFSDNYTQAFPVLKKHQVPATIFVVSDFIDKPEPIWFEVIANAFLQAPLGSISHAVCGFGLPSANDRSTRTTELAHALSSAKKVPNSQREEFIEYLKRTTWNSQSDSSWNQYGRAMTWEQLREMSKNGIDIGSHTVSHPILSQITEAQCAKELSDSRLTLLERLGESPPIIAYPEGRSDSFPSGISGLASSAGYEFGVSYVPGVNVPESLQSFYVKRHTVERFMSRERFCAQLALPTIFG